MYELVLYVHIVCAIIWVGGAIWLQLIGIRTTASSDPTDLPRFGKTVEYLGMRVSLPAAILLFVAGLILVGNRWSFGELWISVSMLLWIVSVIAGALYLGPRSKRVSELFDAEGPTSVAARSLMSKVFLVSRIELISFFIIIGLMVFKPGSGVG